MDKAQITSRFLHRTGERIFKYVYKDPEKNMLRLLKIAKRFTGDKMFPKATFERPVEIISDKDNIWHKFAFNALDDLDHDLLTHALLTFAIDLGLNGTKAVRKNREIYNCNIPWVILFDPTSACNLKCRGCWAAEYGHKSNLTLDEMRRIVTEAKALGTHFYMLTGGEPLMRKKDVLTLANENPDCIFLAYTNATMVDDDFCKELLKCKNLALAISIEGTEETNDGRRGEGSYKRTLEAMALLKKYGCLFGTSICYTSENYKAVTSDEFYDKMIECGAKYMWYFHYMPVGSGADTKLLLTPDQREYVFNEIRNKRNSKTGKPIFTVDFQNDAEFVGGCIAGGRNYFHINSDGYAEPCVFIHYSDSNIREKSILECLQSPLFKEYYKGQPFNDNMLRPCPMLENPQALVKMVNRTNAVSTNMTSEESAETLCAKTEEYAKAWAPRAKEIWESRSHFNPKTQYYRDTPEGKENYKAEDF